MTMVTENPLAPAAAPHRGANLAAATAPILVALLVAAPIFFILASLFAPDRATQVHIWSTTGPKYLEGTVLLCLLVGIGSLLLGAGGALLVSMADFPGRRILGVALALPLAVPAYINAYAYGDIFGPFGLIAKIFGAGHAPNIRTLPGAAFILTLSVYPYVYLAMRASLRGRTGALLEAARMLGAEPGRAVWSILLPASRAALAGGLALALMETAADFGVADYFGVPTLSVGVFRTWYGLGDLAAASQIAAALFLIALVLTIVESNARRGLGAESARVQRRSERMPLGWLGGALALLLCAAPVVLGFIAPIAVFANKLGAPGAAAAAYNLGEAAANTTLVASAGAALTVALAAMLVYAARRSHSKATRAVIRAATTGYALPGAVIAIGILAFASALRDGAGLAVSGVALLLYAYAARFMTAGYNAVSGGVAQIHPLSDDAARVLGAGPLRIVTRIHWPIARGSFAAGALIVLIDIAKELPATLLLRPFNFETLATRAYRLASDDRLADAAPAALILILLSIAPVIWLDAVGGARRRNLN